MVNEYQQAWEDSERRFQQIIAKSADGVLIVDQEGIIQFANPAVQAMMGRPSEELLGQPFGYPLLHNETAEVTLLPQHAPTPLVAEMRVVELQWQGANAYLATIRDVTERRQALELIRQQRDLALLLSRSQDLSDTLSQILAVALQREEVDAGGIYLVDEATGDLHLQVERGLTERGIAPVGRYDLADELTQVALAGEPVFATAVAEPHIATLPIEGAQQVAILPIYYDDQVIALLLLASFDHEHWSPFVQNGLEMIAAQIGGFIARAKAETAVRQHNGELQALHDLLQQKIQLLQETQNRLLQSEKLAAMGELIAGLAHELNNPLAAVVLYSQMLLKTNPPEECRADLQQIVDQALRMKQISQTVLRYIQPQAGERRLLSVNEIISRSLAFLEYELRSHNITVDWQPPDDLPLVLVDEQQLQQVLINLINNAFYAMYDANRRGRLQLRVEAGRPLRLREGVQTAVRILVQDDGPGIPAEIQPHVFDRFFTTKQEGAGVGIGLSLCLGLVERQKGRIWFESAPGTTTFVVELPAQAGWSPTPSDQQTIRPSATPRTALAGRVLVVDDEAPIVAALVSVLSDQGYQVEGALSAQSALSDYAPLDQYDLIISDLMMPGMDGMQFYRELNGRFPHSRPPMLFITGDTVGAVAHQFLQESGVPHLSKPFELQELVTAVRRHLFVKPQPVR